MASLLKKKSIDGDTQVEKAGVTLLIDPASYQYLVGAEIDYSDNVEGSQFVIRNPKCYNYLWLWLFVLSLKKDYFPIQKLEKI